MVSTKQRAKQNLVKLRQDILTETNFSSAQKKNEKKTQVKLTL